MLTSFLADCALYLHYIHISSVLTVLLLLLFIADVLLGFRYTLLYLLIVYQKQWNFWPVPVVL